MQSPSQKPDATGELPSLTPLRGIAALWVVLYHYAVLYLPSLNPENYTHLLDKGYLAVDMFFMLSGFVLAHVYRDAFAVAEGSKPYRKFLFARVARLYPLHLFVISLFVATEVAERAVHYAQTGSLEMVPLEGARSLTALVANLFMLQGLKASQLSWNYPAWSISVEFMAYLAFPFALPLIWRARPAWKIVLGVALLSVLAWFAYWTRDNFDQWDGPKTLLRCLPEFMVGILLYNLYRDGRSRSIMRRDATFLGIVLAMLLLLHVGAPDLLIIILFPVLILAAVRNAGYAAGFLNGRALSWLGAISYSLYLVHGFVQFATTKMLAQSGFGSTTELSGLSSLALTAAMVSASLLLATITYYAVEKAGRRYLRSLLGVRSAARLQKSRSIEPHRA